MNAGLKNQMSDELLKLETIQLLNFIALLIRVSPRSSAANIS
jgi:hypothetical protein